MCQSIHAITLWRVPCRASLIIWSMLVIWILSFHKCLRKASQKKENKLFGSKRRRGKSQSWFPSFTLFPITLRPFEVRAVFKNYFKLTSLSRFQEVKSVACTVKHRQLVGNCMTGIVYRIPTKRVFCYIGQTGQCFNQRMTEHYRITRIHASQSQLACHIADCNLCHSVWDKCTTLARENDSAWRPVKETLFIFAADNAISHPALLFDRVTHAFLGI